MAEILTMASNAIDSPIVFAFLCCEHHTCEHQRQSTGIHTNTQRMLTYFNLIYVNDETGNSTSNKRKMRYKNQLQFRSALEASNWKDKSNNPMTMCVTYVPFMHRLTSFLHDSIVWAIGNIQSYTDCKLPLTKPEKNKTENDKKHGWERKAIGLDWNGAIEWNTKYFFSIWLWCFCMELTTSNSSHVKPFTMQYNTIQYNVIFNVDMCVCCVTSCLHWVAHEATNQTTQIKFM